MARGSSPGEYRGGRAKGTPNKATLDVQAKLAALGCDPFEGMARLALQRGPCPTCRGAGKARFSISEKGPYADPDRGAEITCLTCLGTGFEPIEPKIRANMFAELAQYVAPKRKAVEVGNLDGAAFRVEGVSRPGRLSRDEWIRQREIELGAK